MKSVWKWKLFHCDKEFEHVLLRLWTCAAKDLNMCYYGFEQAEWVLCWYMCHSIPGYCEHMFDVISLYSSPLPYQQPHPPTYPQPTPFPMPIINCFHRTTKFDTYKITIDFKTEIIVFPIGMFWWGGVILLNITQFWTVTFNSFFIFNFSNSVLSSLSKEE